MKIGAIIQARTSSTRLPEKVLKNLPCNHNITVLEQVIRRLKRSEKLDDIIIATTTDENDKKIIDIAEKEKITWFRGSKENVLERYYLAAKENELDVIVRITSDCPCVDPDIVDFLLENHLKNKGDYTSNTTLRTFPVGLDVEVVSFEALKTCYYNADTDLEKEHVTSYIHHNLSHFKTDNLISNEDMSQVRITLDTEEDYTLLCAVFDYLYEENELFKYYDIISLFKDKPWLKNINKKIMAKKSFETLEDELDEALHILEMQELNNAKEILEKSMK
ncbi:MAG: acylneuraminate cytidylyltransferase [Methanobacteriales archaeon HGW-Methanobacteriales-1]|jgi:spore coat polysaccharide biosynthesis protein SpsF|nr:MAG: acylneuraminate cytidylyltransferase [Methanobacteriales archaeon HGW-Methanobacteriales-1]